MPDKSLRVLMLNNEFPPLGGGTGTVNQALLRRFASVPGLEIDLVTSALGKTQEDEALAERIHLYKVPVNNQNIHHSSNRELATYGARALPLAISLHRARPYDLCFAWCSVPAGGVALALRRSIGLRYVVRVSGPDIPGFENRYARLYPILKPVVRAIWRGAEIVVAKCEGEADMIRAVDTKAPITLVPNGVDLKAFPPGEQVPDDGPLRLLCVARLIERKGQHHLIEAVKQLTDQGVEVTLDLVGTGDAAPAYEELVRNLGLADRVNFAGYVPRSEIARYYAAAHVFALPSRNEGMSVATLEAMAAGLPAVVTHAGGMAELIEEGVNGLTFDWGNVEALVEHLGRLAAERTLVRQMGNASRARAAGFTWEAVSEHYVMMYAEVSQQKELTSWQARGPEA